VIVGVVAAHAQLGAERFSNRRTLCRRATPAQFGRGCCRGGWEGADVGGGGGWVKDGVHA